MIDDDDLPTRPEYDSDDIDHMATVVLLALLILLGAVVLAVTA